MRRRLSVDVGLLLVVAAAAIWRELKRRISTSCQVVEFQATLECVVLEVESRQEYVEANPARFENLPERPFARAPGQQSGFDADLGLRLDRSVVRSEPLVQRRCPLVDPVADALARRCSPREEALRALRVALAARWEPGSGAERLTRDSTVKDRPVMSRDGRRIAYAVNHLGRRFLSVLDPAAGTTTAITPREFNSVDPAFDAAGGMVLFAADRDGTPEIYEVSTTGSDLQRLTWDGLGARSPCATPSKDHILVSEKGNIYLYSLKERSRKMLSFRGDSAPDWHPR
jgi:hypothetical protein